MTTTQAPRSYRPAAAIPLAALVVATAGSGVNAGIALASGALGADSSLPGVQPIAFISLTTVAAIGGAIGWHLINRLATSPSRVMAWLVPAFLAVSFIPDILVGTVFGWPYALTLALMHLATIAIGVATYRRYLPLRDRQGALV